MSEERSIGTIGNPHRELVVKEDDGKFWWGLEDCGGTKWQEIPQNLYDALVRFDEVGMEGE